MTNTMRNCRLSQIKLITAALLPMIIFLFSNSFSTTSAAIIDSDLSRALADFINSEELIISVKNLDKNKRRKYAENLFALEFPGTSQKLSLQLDRGNKKVIIHSKLNSDLDSQTFILDNSTDESGIKILFLDVKQGQNLEKAEVTLYVDCIKRGTFKLAKKLRDAYTSMRNPQLYFSHEEKYEINVDSDLSIDDVMLQHGNCPSDMQATEPKDNGRQNMIRSTIFSPITTTSQRSDLPPPSFCDFNTECCSMKMSSFVDIVSKLQQELSYQRTEIQELIGVMKQCHACKGGVCPLGYIVEEGMCKPSSVCRTSPCYPGVTCTELGSGQYQCGPCPSGFTGDGKMCRRLHCQQSPCYTGVLCRDVGDGYQCGPCPPHFTGNGQTCYRLWCDLNPCYPGVECTSNLGTFKCSSCPAGFTGDGIICKPILTIQPCDSNPCFSGVDCVNVGSEFKCGPCPRDFVGDGIKCIPKTPRLPCNNNPCFEGVQCFNTNTGAGFSCGSCPPYYTGDGIRCEPCDRQTCPTTATPTQTPSSLRKCPPNACYSGVTCEMMESGPKCGACPAQFTGDGVHCKQIITCSNYYCFPGVECSDTQDGPKCGKCPERYTGNGIYCKRILTCRDQPCFPGTECYESGEDGFRCGKCPAGFTGNGVNCERFLSCRDSPCFPGVSCNETQQGPKCGQCPAGFIGDGYVCTKVVTCQDQPCQPGFKCITLQTHPYHKCESCLAGQTFDGTTCSDIDECTMARPCDSRVVCHNTNPGFYCDPCPAGYTGNVPHGIGLEYARQNNQYCVDIDECAYNNGNCPDICVNMQGSYRCIKRVCRYVCTQNVTTHVISKRSSRQDILKRFGQHNCINKCDTN